MTYKQAQDAYKKKYGKVVKTCWIADIKREFNPSMKPAPNRLGDTPTNPCPADVYPKLKKIMMEGGMI